MHVSLRGFLASAQYAGYCFRDIYVHLFPDGGSQTRHALRRARRCCILGVATTAQVSENPTLARTGNMPFNDKVSSQRHPLCDSESTICLSRTYPPVYYAALPECRRLIAILTATAITSPCASQSS